MSEITVGMVGEASMLVTTELTAASYASGLVPAFATPALVALMENAAFSGTKPYLPPGHTSVGLEVNVRHLAATPIGMRVRSRAEVTQVEGRKLTFKVEAWDDVDKIGEGTHVRVIVDENKFNERFRAKLAQVGTTGQA